ncbi:VOC family protein [Azospirillum sp.]|uniref:VOC family protein n=1 Tax=Azospirillum sp. TaxID=34012 RepID=UPI002D26CE68|nr:VOC family protein [Azospirillum sp.]HYF89095.1 VOC family protein [Azospirillum sp.]
MHVQPYLFFEGRCEEALDFYARTLGAEVRMMMRFKDSPDPAPEGVIPPGFEDKVMHAEVQVGDSVLFASDGCCSGTSGTQGFGLSLTVKDEAEADRVYAALGDGGRVVMPIGKTFFSPRFGMVADRFGVTWMVIVPG